MRLRLIQVIKGLSAYKFYYMGVGSQAYIIEGIN